MNKKELLELIKTGEGYTLEFKESVSSSIGRDICAFSNSSGGKIILGVKDNGEIKGYKLSNRDKSRILDIVKNIEPSVKIRIEKVANLGVIFVPEGKDKPYFLVGHCYIREGASSVLLKRDEIKDFFQRENLIQFDKKPNYEFNWEDDFNKKAFENFRERAKIPKELSVKHVLRNLNLITNEKINNAGALFFCNDLKKFFPNAGIVVVLYKTPNKADVMDIKEFYDDFISNYENIVKYIMLFLNKEIKIKGLKRIETLEIPEEALREALINAMTHRDYFIQSRVQIDIYPDRLEITNPGKLLFDEKDLGEISIARNPIIFDLAYRLGYVEKIGSGIKRIKNLVPDVEFKIGSNWFRVIFKRPIPQKTPQKTPQKILTPLETKILEKIRNNPQISRNKIAEELGISAETVKEYLERLKKKNIIKRVGPAKGGYWKVLE